MAVTFKPGYSFKDDDMIVVAGRKGSPIPYGEIKGAVIYLGGEFFFKDDEENIVNVRVDKGKSRLFRRKSKMIVELSPGRYALRKNIVSTPDGVMLDMFCENTVQVDGAYARKDYTVEIDGKRYLKSNPDIVKCALGNEFLFKKDTIELSARYATPRKGGSTLYVSKKYGNDVVTTEKNELILRRDSFQMMNALGNIIVIHNDDHDRHEPRTNVFHKFRDTTNPQFNRVDHITVYNRDLPNFKLLEELPGMYIHPAHADEFLRIYHQVILVRDAAETKTIKAALKYADDGPDENGARIVKKVNEPWGGKQVVYQPLNKRIPIISQSCNLLGGLNYTFGVELETSQGICPNKYMDETLTLMVGDRSIGAGEYVTPVLHGDDGLKCLEALCKALANTCLVDDRCGVHVHVGGMKEIKGVAQTDFNRHFAIGAIKLGCQIEKELYETCPPSRGPMLKHCHSIMRYKGIDEKNWKEYLGSFVFGPEENWKKPFSLHSYSYGAEGVNRNTSVDNWCGGRYKWLNLVHILAKSKLGTCELRLFPGSTNYEKIYNYVLLSMAFVWMVENRMGLIEKGNVTLEQVLSEPFIAHRRPEIAARLVAFYQARKDKFKRTNLYPEVIPPAIF